MYQAGHGKVDAPLVPVQLTTVVPLRVYDAQGEYFDTEVDVHQPLRVIQIAIEDYFHVRPEVQLLLHNRQQVDPSLSLHDNGCLLLKGDPFVKIVFHVRRGPVLNIICDLGKEKIALACHEESTIWSVKEQLAEEVRRRMRHPDIAVTAAAADPHRHRLLWRYMELNDKATLHYYRVPTNGTFRVRLKKGRTNAPVLTRPALDPTPVEVYDPRAYTAVPPATTTTAPPPPVASGHQVTPIEAPAPRPEGEPPYALLQSLAREVGTLEGQMRALQSQPPGNERHIRLLQERIIDLEHSVQECYALLERTVALLPVPPPL
ncbi:hypothetical protein ADEAN_000261200 [Angomonas deanei]|uniref:Ubiquitin-like domain-containing protein n=1 Tax=Angomonas deanei TaxID=59799 RepID=A0A7G2C8L0_9TRYP|nr:hypothetical protein ADEAN_000261200 [Angomonas deanei]